MQNFGNNSSPRDRKALNPNTTPQWTSKSIGDHHDYQNLQYNRAYERNFKNKYVSNQPQYEHKRRDINAQIYNNQYLHSNEYTNGKINLNYHNSHTNNSQTIRYETEYAIARKRKNTQDSLQIPQQLIGPFTQHKKHPSYQIQKQINGRTYPEEKQHRFMNAIDYSTRQKSISHQNDDIYAQKIKKIENIEQYHNNQIKQKKSNDERVEKWGLENIKIYPHNAKQKGRQKIKIRQGQIKFAFEKIEQLGQGSYGKVLLVEQTKTKALYAMKIMEKKEIKLKNNQENIGRQIIIQSYLDHPNIIKLYKQFEDEQNVYLIMEYMKQSLFQTKENTPAQRLKEKTTSQILEQIIKAAIYIHKQHIIHRDLKLQNIMISDLVVKIGDFGCAVHTLNMRRTKIGSPAYYSPQLLKDSPYNQKVDIWSLGIITYQLLFGEAPYNSDIIKIMKKTGKKQLSNLKFPPSIEVSQEAKDFIRKLLQKDPQKRISLQNALEHRFIILHKQSSDQIK